MDNYFSCRNTKIAVDDLLRNHHQWTINRPDLFNESEYNHLKPDTGTVPADWTPAKRCQKDLDATWTKKHGNSYHGYKISIDDLAKCPIDPVLAIINADN